MEEKEVAKQQPEDQAEAIQAVGVAVAVDSQLDAAALVTEAKDMATQAAAANVTVTIIGKDNHVTLITPMGVELVVFGATKEDTETVLIRVAMPLLQI